MLPYLNRLSKKADIDRAFKKCRFSAYIGSIGIKAGKNNLKNSRFAIVVSLKVSKKAVERNKLKRQIREIIRLKIIPIIKPGYDCVILTKKETLNFSYKELESVMLKLLKKSGLI